MDKAIRSFCIGGHDDLKITDNYCGCADLLIVLLIMDIFPGIVDWMTQLLGIELPINMLTFCGLAFAFVLIFSLTTAISRLNERQKKLVQEIALLKKKLDERTEEE